MSRRIAFMGSPDFAVAILRALVEENLDVVGVVTQPDRPAGRGRALRPPAVKVYAEERGLEVYQPPKVRKGRLAAWLQEREIDLVIVAAYGRVLPADVLAAPRLGCVNVHASLLPRWRGAAPIQYAIATGDALSGVCLMQMDAGLDTGPVLARMEVEIEDFDTGQSLHDRLADAGARLIRIHHRALLEGTLPATPQDDDASRAAPPLHRSDGQIAWDRPARAIDRHIRAMTPWPGSWTTWQGHDEVWKLFADGLQVGELTGKPGTLLDIDGNGANFACGEGSLRIATMQRPGRRRMDAGSALRGARIEAGACCDVEGRRFDDER